MKKLLIQINKVIHFILYLISILLGIFGTIWIIWSRFLRERTIREVPDLLLTEYRFWILLYICLIYLYIIKSLLKPKDSSILGETLSTYISYIYKPLTILDNAIKYTLLKKSYYEFTLLFSQYIRPKSTLQMWMIIYFQILPRGILVLFLFADTFYFEKLQIFYKVIIFGVFPLVFRYIKHSIKDIYEHYITLLEEKYSKVRIYQEGFEFDYKVPGQKEEYIQKSTALWHNEYVTIREYIEIKVDTDMEWLLDESDFRYLAKPYSKENIQEEYKWNKYKTNNKYKFLNSEDYKLLNELFYNLIDRILNIRDFVDQNDAWNRDKYIRYAKASIFSIYLICWGYILIRSYYTTPIELTGFKHLISLFIQHLFDYANPFCE